MRPMVRWKARAPMFYVDGENELLVCQLCQKPFSSLGTAWLASPADGGAAIWTHRHCIDRHGERVLGSFRYRLRRGDSALRSVIQRLLTVDGFPPVVRWDRDA
jgi:hypothetical protein